MARPAESSTPPSRSSCLRSSCCTKSSRCRSTGTAASCSSAGTACHARRWRAWALDHVKGTAAQRLPDHRRRAHHLRRHGARACGVVARRRARVFAVLFVGLANLAPVLLLPIFFTFKPLDRDALRGRLEQLAARAGTRIVGVYEWALGTRTRKANAALAGLGNTRRILVSDTMLDQYSDDEIEVVLAHELGASRAPRHLAGPGARNRADPARVLRRGLAPRRLGRWSASRAWRSGGRAARRGGGRRGLAGPAAVRAGALAASRAPRGSLRARSHEEPQRVRHRDAPPRRAEPRRRAARHGSSQWLFYSHPPLDERLAAARGLRQQALADARHAVHDGPLPTSSRVGLRSACDGRRRRSRPDFGCTTSSPCISLQPLVLLQVAVEAERAGLIGAELEGDRLAWARRAWRCGSRPS